MAKLLLHKYVGIAFGLLGLLAFVLLVQFAPLDPVIEWLEEMGPWGPAAFIAIYILTSVALVPGLVLNVAAGTLFGTLLGSTVALIGTTIGAILSFSIARTFGREHVRKWMKGEKVEALDRAVGRAGFKVVLASRLSPGVPFNTLNYVFGLTRVRFREYALGSLIGMIPYRVAYAYFGSILGSVSEVLGKSGESNRVEWVITAGGVLTTLIFVVWMARLAKQELEAQLETPEGKSAS